MPMLGLLFFASTLFPYEADQGRSVDGWRLNHQADGICGIEGELGDLRVAMFEMPRQPDVIYVGVGNRSWTTIATGGWYDVQVWSRKKLLQTKSKGYVGPQGDHFVIAPLARKDVIAAAGHDLRFIYQGKEIAEVAPENAEPIAAITDCIQSGSDPFARH